MVSCIKHIDVLSEEGDDPHSGEKYEDCHLKQLAQDITLSIIIKLGVPCSRGVLKRNDSFTQTFF